MWHPLTFLLLTLALSEGCPDLYRRYSSEHTFCKPPNSACEIVAQGVSAADQNLIVKVHNEFRSRVATGKETNAGGLPTAANMLEMVWDDELAQLAEKLAKTCHYNHDCNNCRKVKAFSVGQNIGMVFGYSSAPRRADWEGFIKRLYGEVTSFDKQYIKPFNPGPLQGPGVYGHFSQVIWATSWRIGCGWAAFKAGNTIKSYTVCNYGPVGNVWNKELYKVGPPYSACPKNTCGGESCKERGTAMSNYPGLCKVIDPTSSPEGSGPHDSGKYFFFCDFSGQEDCLSTVEGKQWTTEHTAGGNYLSIVLNGGEWTKLTFKKKFSPAGRFCTKLVIRKGPNVAGEADAGKGSTTLDIGFFKATFNLRFMGMLLSMRQNFIPFLYGFSTDNEVTVRFKYSVPPGAPPQFVEIQEISAKEGRCTL